MIAPPMSKPITDLVFVRLITVTGVDSTFRTEVPDHPPVLLDVDGKPTDRVAPYTVLYPFPGKAGDPSQQPADWSLADLDYGFQVTCAAGFSADAEYLTDQVRALYEGWTPSVDGVVCGQFRQPVGFDPGPVQRSGPNITPPRFWVPLQYRLTATV
jgi:hypothetical protein